MTMFTDDNDIKELAMRFEKSLDSLMGQMLSFSSADLLDLMDYYSATGRDFESDLCQKVAQRLYSDDVEVKITQAHNYGDEGNWQMVSAITSQNRGAGGFTAYDLALFRIEKLIRRGMPWKAQEIVYLTLNKDRTSADYDFMFDCAAMFRDYGYTSRCIALVDAIGKDYVEYAQVLQLKADALIIRGDYDEASLLLNEMLDNDPFDKSLWSRLAQCQLYTDQIPLALESGKNALALGSDAEARRITTYIGATSGRFDDFGFYNYLIVNGITIQDYMIHLDLALHFRRQKLFEHSLEALSFAGLYCPRGCRDREIIVYLIADSQIQINQVDSAIENLRSLQAISPNYGPYFINAASALIDKGHEVEAIDLLALAASEYQTSATRLAVIANMLSQWSLFELARELWQMIIKNMPILPPLARKQAASAARKLGMEGQDHQLDNG